MMTYEIKTYKKCAFLNITSAVKEALLKSGVQNGILCVFCPHTTAGITINENADPDVALDILSTLDKTVPQMSYAHVEGNSPAHIKALLTGSSVTIPVVSGAMAIGRWQGIYFCEYDGPRDRKFFVQTIGQ